MTPPPIDETDRLILEALWKDARQSHQSIADSLGVSEGTVRSRLRRLESQGVVRFTAIRNIRDAPTQALAYLWIRCDRTRIREVGSALAAEPLVGYVGALLGRADLLAIARYGNAAELVRFVDDVVKKLQGVIDVRTQPVLQVVKADHRWGIVDRPK